MIASITSFSPIRKYVTLAFTFLFCFGIMACEKTPGFSPPTLAVLPFRETYSLAESLAKAWRSDAQLNYANFDIIVNSSSDNFRCSYAFLSPRSREFLMVFVRISDSGYDLTTTQDAWPTDQPIGTAISFEEINLESQEALNSIMEEGGNSFFERYRVHKNQFMDMLFLRLQRLDEYTGQGPVTWTSGFAINNPHAQLYISLEDATGDLLKVRAYGKEEQDYWLRDITVTKKILVGGSENFFDFFDLRLDKITYENGRRYADFTLISPEMPGLIHGEVTHTHTKQNSVLHFGGYDITLVNIDREWIEVEVMPIDRWYKPKPVE